MSHPLIQRLLDELGYAEVSLDNHDAFVARPGLNVLFFPGDPAVAKDATDVAVVLPELVAEFGGKLRPGVVTDTWPSISKKSVRILTRHRNGRPDSRSR
ncbi:MAG: hypothetical protein P8X98_13490 [Woeseiaceae bacterium]